MPRRLQPILPFTLGFVAFVLGGCGSTPAMPKGPPPEYEDNPTPLTASSSAPDSGQAPK